ncbi:glucokinase [Rhodalgimonas zhirmunskyi]|uniref:Glucokinase n=1 Tax=Rhodalgimonas zhirmunskyi TaxID=2964767 RepID=A0AAJ1U2Z3_9RHOB|nr:glucokinase [Rhodoalgimonas zhirmunskyi]MDQ2092695.1 glucokinase [Rhodoalgimonas zhirmunskyi]
MTRLVADIGGTHSRLALADGPRVRPDSLRHLRNADSATPQAMFAAYLVETGATPDAACIAAAGPVTGQTVQLTNHPWHIDATDIVTGTGTSIPPNNILILNDLQAMGHALAAPEIAGSPLEAPRLVLALGTGMNAALAYRVNGRIFVPAAEYGFTALPFTRPEDSAILAAIAADFGTPVVESVLSGPGLTRAHRLLTGQERTPEEITAQGGPARDLALRVLGRMMASLARAHLPHGGLYLAGSLGRALHPLLNDPNFLNYFDVKGPYASLLNAIKIGKITDDAAALHGAALALDQYLS